MDRRFLHQIALLSGLVVLPVVMICLNGVRAVSVILTPTSKDTAHSATLPWRTSPAVRNSSDKRPLQFGVYDPGDVFAEDKVLTIRHIYISWVAFEPELLGKQLRQLCAASYTPLLTMEPWPHTDAAGELLSAITNGEYDEAIDDIASALEAVEGPLYLCWGHEMDQDLTARYPWSGRDPSQYVTAYRYVVDRLRRDGDARWKWVWAGVLKSGSLRYYPGDAYVDVIGMPIYSFPQWDQRTYGFVRDFRETYEEKRAIVKTLNKPLLITEMGVTGSPDFEAFWLRQAFLSLDAYPELTGIVFFYDRDTEYAWGKDVDTPDWRVHPDAIRGLVKWKLSPSR